MRNRCDALALLYHSCIHQRTGCDKQDIVQLAGVHQRQDMSAHDGSTASTAACTGVYILFFKVIQHQPAVGLAVFKVIAVPPQQVTQDGAAHFAKVAGDYKVA